MISFSRYVELFRDQQIRRTFVDSIIGRLPIGLTGLAVLLLVQNTTGSFGAGGAAAASYVVGLAALAPLLGRAIDRWGPRPILIVSGLTFPASLAGLVAAVTGGHTHLSLALAGAAGASFPPITVCVRTYFRRRLGNDPLLSAAYSAESLLIEVIFIAGPMLVATLMALASAATAVWFSAASALIGTFIFLRSPALRTWQVEARNSRSLLGPLAERRFPALVIVVLCFSSAFGFMEIAIAAYATDRGNPALAGVLLGVMSIGSALGALTYGGRVWRYALARQFVVALAMMAAGLAVLAAPWPPLVFSLWCVLAGIAMAPALIIQSMLAAQIARAEHATEAFTWTTSALLAGVGIGLAVGGGMLEIWPASAALVAAAGAALLAALLALAAL